MRLGDFVNDILGADDEDDALDVLFEHEWDVVAHLQKQFPEFRTGDLRRILRAGVTQLVHFAAGDDDD